MKLTSKTRNWNGQASWRAGHISTSGNDVHAPRDIPIEAHWHAKLEECRWGRWWDVGGGWNGCWVHVAWLGNICTVRNSAPQPASIALCTWTCGEGEKVAGYLITFPCHTYTHWTGASSPNLEVALWPLSSLCFWPLRQCLSVGKSPCHLLPFYWYYLQLRFSIFNMYACRHASALNKSN